MRGNNLRRYALWQIRDFGRERGIALLIIGLALGSAVIAPVRMMRAPMSELGAKQLLSVSMQQIVFICAFVALNGIVSNDRKMGYYRFLFSKPVSIPAYYFQQFVVYFAGFIAVMAALLGVFALVIFPVSPVGPLIFCVLVFLSLGGVAFFISTLFRFDWPILAAVFLGSSLLHALWDDSEGWKRLVIAVLPPLNRLSGMLQPLLAGESLNTNSLLWLLGYSLLFFLGGLVVLRRRSFA